MVEGEGQNKSLLEKLLGVVTEVRAGEGITALLLTFNVFLLLHAYYLIKPVREALILAMKGGAEYKSYMGAVIAIALLLAVPAYSRFASRLPRNRLVVGVTLFFVSHLVIFYGLRAVPVIEENLGLIFFVWVGIFNMMVVAQFWAFANDLYSAEQGKRLFPLIGLGASVGAAVGATISGIEEISAALGVYNMLLVSGALLGACAFLTQITHVRETRMTTESKKEVDAPDPKKTKGAYGLVFKHRYLTLIAFFSLLFTFVNTNGEYILGRLFKAAASKAVDEALAPLSAEIDYHNAAKIAVRVESARIAIEKHYDADEALKAKKLSAEAVDGDPLDQIRFVDADGKAADIPAVTPLAFADKERFLAGLGRLEKRGLKHFILNEDLYLTLEKEGTLESLTSTGAAGGGLQITRGNYTHESWKKSCAGSVIGVAFGRFFGLVNIIGVLLQMLIVSRLIRYFGLSRSFYIFPVIALFNSALFVIIPTLAVIRAGKSAENATDYSLNNTLRHMLWLPTTKQMKYKAKQAVDTFFVRMGDVSSGALVFVGTALAFNLRSYAITNVFLIAVWLVLASRIVSKNKEMERRKEAGDLEE